MIAAELASAPPARAARASTARRAAPRSSALPPRAAAAAASAASAPAAKPAAGRRALLAGAAAAAAASLLPARAGAAAAAPYTDHEDGWSLAPPPGWALAGVGALGAAPSRFSNAAGLQRVVAWTPPGGATNAAAVDSASSAPTAAASLAVTARTPSADFTTLGSFGSASDFAEGVVAAMDTRYVKRARGAGFAATTAVLLSAAERGGRYLLEYTVAKEGEPARRVVSAVALGRGGARAGGAPIRRFYTVTASCGEADAGALGPALRAAVESFAPAAAP
jgi:hypothetical protein